LKSLIKWAVLALVVFAILVISHEPLYWKRYTIALLHGGELPASAYTPQARVRGSNQPPAPRETPASESLDAPALQAAADYAGAHHSQALIVSRHGYLVFEKYWQGTNLDTVIDSRGLGRVVAALAVGIALSDRKIGWPDEPISYLVPGLHDDPRGMITVRNLLQLSSGLGSPSSGAREYGSDMATQNLNLPLEALPGTRWLDQSADPDLLGFILQRATGESYNEYVSHAIWARIGAGDAVMWLDRPGGVPHVDRGFFARTGDWMRVAEVLLRNGNYQGDEVVVPRWVPEMLQPAKSNPDYGAYIRLGAHTAPGMTPYVTDDVFVVSGGGNRLWFVPSLQLAILRTGDATDPDWDDARIPNLVIRGARDFVPPAARPGADVRQLVPNH
jgi:CubicO group peptidase (beta-lactamase class C family)